MAFKMCGVFLRNFVGWTEARGIFVGLLFVLIMTLVWAGWLSLVVLVPENNVNNLVFAYGLATCMLLSVRCVRLLLGGMVTVDLRAPFVIGYDALMLLAHDMIYLIQMALNIRPYTFYIADKHAFNTASLVAIFARRLFIEFSFSYLIIGLRGNCFVD